ncbi:type II toxin-antitoxin system RelE/ParE family toxin [Kitasatospora sp. NPDC086791]|uniref:type II toxin-antitoxin system RelE family toxin n=1 Tax=Kitasatospora sp. NPDC086791 TaxID=3155178 RepID=UPI003434772B
MGCVTRFTAHGQRDLLKVPLPDARRIMYRLTEFQRALDAGTVESFDIKSVQGHPGLWRLRVGDYRVVYTIEDGQLIVWVVAVGNRRDICRRY